MRQQGVPSNLVSNNNGHTYMKTMKRHNWTRIEGGNKCAASYGNITYFLAQNFGAAIVTCKRYKCDSLRFNVNAPPTFCLSPRKR